MMNHAVGIPLLFIRFLAAPGSQQVWIILLALVAWGVLLFRASRRPDRRWLPLRMVWLTLTVGSLLLAGLQPAREVGVDPGTALLLTPGSRPEVVDSLRRNAAPDLVATFDAATAALFPFASLLPDLEYLRRHFPDVQRIHLVGSGLSEQELQHLSGLELRFHPAGLPGGVTDLRYSREVAEGETLHFTGYYHQTENDQRRLFLESPNGKDLLLASDSAGHHFFSLEIPARKEGLYLFQLVEETSRRRLLHQAPLPVRINPSPTLRVLFLNDAPGFETRFLKNWLVDQGYRVAVRTAISRDRYWTEFNNLPEMDLTTVSNRTLENFDLIVLPVSTLSRGSPPELWRATEGGLGVVMLAGEELTSSVAGAAHFFMDFPLLSGTPVFQLSDEDVEVELEKAPYHIRESFGTFPLIKSSTGKVVAAFHLRGAGRVALQLATTTYRLPLAGKEEAYARHWTTILESAARQTVAGSRWDSGDPLLLRPHAPVEVKVHTSMNDPVGLLVAPDSSKAPFYLAEDPLLPGRWSGVVWPRREGWHNLSLQGNSTDDTWIYVPDAEAWEGLRQARHQKDTHRWISRHHVSATTTAATITRYENFPLWWFFVVFLLAAGGLWLEEKW